MGLRVGGRLCSQRIRIARRRHPRKKSQMMGRCGIGEPEVRVGLAADGLLHIALALIGQLLGKLEPRVRKWDTVAHGPEIRQMLICRYLVSHP